MGSMAEPSFTTRYNTPIETANAPKQLRRYVAASPEAMRQTGTMVQVSMGNRQKCLTCNRFPGHREERRAGAISLPLRRPLPR